MENTSLWTRCSTSTRKSQGYGSGYTQGNVSTFGGMTFELTHLDGRAEEIGDADTYEQEGPLTTFFSTCGREYVDSWAVRLASFRTADIASIRRLEGSTQQVEQLPRLVDQLHCSGVA